MAKNKFNTAWLHDHINDPYVKLAQKHGYRARAAYKLKEIDETDRLIRPGDVVVDLGATPGSWSQYVRERLKKGDGIDGRIIALDLLPMEPIADVDFFLGDFREDEVLAQLEARLADLVARSPDGRCVDLVLSDMAPNLSGIGTVDRARGVHLAELALEFALAWLQPGGDFAVKMFQGEGFDEFQRLVAGHFTKTYVRKPKASRDRSREVFVVGKGLRAVQARQVPPALDTEEA
jgi:23S rRNA (uridine2552-2'-O)-methyltransferase